MPKKKNEKEKSQKVQVDSSIITQVEMLNT